MAINSQKFLPPSKIKSSSAIVKAEKVVPSLYKKVSSIKVKEGSEDIGSQIVVIKKKVIDINKLVANITLLKTKEEEEKRKLREDKKREDKEEENEKRKEDKTIKLPKFSLPRTGFLDSINRFITFTFLGWIFNQVYPYLPQILKFAKLIEPVVKFLEILTGNFFKGLTDFIDGGYKAYDTVRDFTKKLGGDPFQKAFDGFTSNLNKFVNLAIIAGMLAIGGPEKGKGGSSAGVRLKPEEGGRPKITTSGGGSAGKPDIRNPLRERPKITGGDAAKGAGRFAKMGRFGLPVVGALIDFGIRTLVFKEPLDRAAAGSIGFGIGQALGSWIGGAIGTAAGSVVPIIGNLLGGAAGVAVGGILGGMLGDLIGTSLLDTIKYYQSQSKPIKKQAVGGKVTTRKGQVVGGEIKRTVRKTITPPTPTPVSAGKDVGGEKQIQKIYPRGEEGKTVDPFGFITDTTTAMGQVPFIGPLFSFFGKLLVGQFPTSADYDIIGTGINAWISNAISKGILKGNLTKGFADGGIIDTDMMRDISGWVSSSIEELVKNKVTKAIEELRKNLGLKPLQEIVSGEDITDDTAELGSASDAIGGARLLMAAGFPPLAAAILAGNIQQESGWKGQRTPWVLNDGAGTNKGLISWNRTRIQNAEKFLGKPLEKASNAEQVKWIKEELRQYGLLDEFMDPNRTEDQLKNDSYKYIGWGHEGDRWKYSRQIYAAIQKGEQGTYQPPSTTPTSREGTGWKPQKPGLFNAIQYITGDKNHPNFELSGHGLRSNYHDHIAFKTIQDKERAKAALRSAGIKIGSEFRPGDPGYHGSNLAIDIPGYQWGGRGEIGQKEFEGSKKVRSVLGLKDGGLIQPIKKSPNIKTLQSFASYDDEVTIMIQPIIIEKTVPVGSNRKSLNFPGGGSGIVNRSSTYSQLSIR